MKTQIMIDTVYSHHPSICCLPVTESQVTGEVHEPRYSRSPSPPLSNTFQFILGYPKAFPSHAWQIYKTFPADSEFTMLALKVCPSVDSMLNHRAEIKYRKWIKLDLATVTSPLVFGLHVSTGKLASCQSFFFFEGVALSNQLIETSSINKVQ